MRIEYESTRSDKQYFSKIKDKSEKIHKDINGNPISSSEMIKILRGIQKDNGEDFEDDYSYFNW